MPNVTEKGKRPVGRPRRDGNYQHVGFGLRLDLYHYARAKAAEEGRSMASALQALVEKGAAVEIMQKEAAKKRAERRNA